MDSTAFIFVMLILMVFEVLFSLIMLAEQDIVQRTFKGVAISTFINGLFIVWAAILLFA